MRSNLLSLKKANSLQWSIISYMNSLNLIQSDITDLRNEFQALDKDSNGKLSITEIRNILTAHLNFEECESLEAILKDMVDTNGSGFIDYSEFLSLTV